jgi:hypothetical protein
VNPIFNALCNAAYWMLQIAIASVILMSEWEKRSEARHPHADEKRKSPDECADEHCDPQGGVPTDDPET